MPVFGVPQLGYAAWLHVLELISAWSLSLQSHSHNSLYEPFFFDPDLGFESSLRASMRPTVHDTGFTVVSPETKKAHVVE
jgi:hypothetical protein